MKNSLSMFMKDDDTDVEDKTLVQAHPKENLHLQ